MSIISARLRQRPSLEVRCKRCDGNDMVLDHGESCCRTCGLVDRLTFDHEFHPTQFGSDSATYQRIFYFNERCTRWGCCEPTIAPDIMALIQAEATDEKKYGNLKSTCNRTLINRILRSVNITPELSMKHRSRKFKMQPLTKKRFYDKYAEKWKTIRWQLTGVPPLLPSHQLVDRVKRLFVAAQIPFNNFRHHIRCDGRQKCEKYFKCQHNFTNYDYFIRQALQLADAKYGFQNSYETFKHEFPLVSPKVVSTKLRPMFHKICAYNEWPIPPRD